MNDYHFNFMEDAYPLMKNLAEDTIKSVYMKLDH